VTVGIGFHDGHHGSLRTDELPDEIDVVANGRRVDVGPLGSPLFGQRNRSMTRGISGKRSDASTPARPRECSSAIPARPCRWTPVTAASNGVSFWAINPPFTPASTPPVPPAARAGGAMGFSAPRPSGAAITGPAPLATPTW